MELDFDAESERARALAIGMGQAGAEGFPDATPAEIMTALTLMVALAIEGLCPDNIEGATALFYREVLAILSTEQTH